MTFFEGVFSLPPAHMAVLSSQGFAKRRYWDFDPGRTILLGSFEEYAEAFFCVFEQAVQRRLRSTHPVAVSVSGGLDSSSILCMAETLARREPGSPLLHGVSYISEEGSPSDEQKFLVEIEKKYGTTIHRVPSDPMGLLDGSEDVVRHGESPWLDGLWSTVRDSFRTVQQIGGRVVLTGSWGDHVLFHQAYLIDLFRRLEWREVRAHLDEYGLWLDDVGPKVFRQRFFLGLLKHHLLRPLYPLIRGIWLNGRIWFKGDRPWFSDTLRRRASGRAWNRPMSDQWKSPSMQARSIYSEVRSARHVLGMEINNQLTSMYGLETAYPFLDRDLVAFLMAIPGEVLTRGGVPKALLRAVRMKRWSGTFPGWFTLWT
jgi:asparagine synthase (glutamine-hydrolysing)